MDDKERSNMSENGFKLKVAERWGYAFRALEEITKAQEVATNERKGLDVKIGSTSKELYDKMDIVKEDICEKIDKMNTRITGLYIKVGTVCGTIGLLVSIIFWMLTKNKL